MYFFDLMRFRSGLIIYDTSGFRSSIPESEASAVPTKSYKLETWKKDAVDDRCIYFCKTISLGSTVSNEAIRLLSRQIWPCRLSGEHKIVHIKSHAVISIVGGGLTEIHGCWRSWWSAPGQAS